MGLDYTFSMIKPDAVRRGLIGNILFDIVDAGFSVAKIRKFRMSLVEAKEFYKSLSHLPFYDELCQYITSDDVVGIVLTRENAVLDFRELIGSTDPLQAKPCTIRRKYGIDKGINSIHGSDSDESAERESSFFDL